MLRTAQVSRYMLSMGGPSRYRDTYAPRLLQPIHVPSPDCYPRGAGESWEDYTRRHFWHMERALEAHAHEVCAVIVEPLIQCAGGMRMYHPLYLTMLREACDRHGVHQSGRASGRARECQDV